MRYYLVDRILEMEPGVRAVGVKCITLSDDLLNEHFPGNPVFPGVLLLEGLAQTAGRLLAEPTGGQRFALLTSIERVRFMAFARPGDQVRLTVEVEAMQDEAARVRGSATVDDHPIASARLVFRLIEAQGLIPPLFEPFWRHSAAIVRGEFPPVTDE